MLDIFGTLKRVYGIVRPKTDALPPLFSNGFAINSKLAITAGTTQTQVGAVALEYGYNAIGTVGTAADGVRLPAATPGAEVIVYNGGANAAKLWPATSDKIDGGTANAGVTIPAGGLFICRAKDAIDWDVQRLMHGIDAGVVTLDGSNPTNVTTRLSSIVAVSFSHNTNTAPGDDPVSFTWTASGGVLSIYAWKNDGTDPTLVASTNAAAVVSWTAIGN